MLHFTSNNVFDEWLYRFQSGTCLSGLLPYLLKSILHPVFIAKRLCDAGIYRRVESVVSMLDPMADIWTRK